MELAVEVKAVCIIIICIMFTYCSSASNDTGIFLKVEDYNCGCPGQNVSYICTAVGGVITVWGGTALKTCTAGNDINLRHRDFDIAAGECNSGAIVGYSIGRINNSYTSRLDVRLSDALQGQTISCSVEYYDLDNNPSTVMVGNDTLAVSSQAEPPPPPDMISAVIPRNNHEIQEEIIFIWEGIEYNCPSLQYDFISTNCGICVLIAPTEVNCSNFIKSTVEVSCNFSVRSKICGNIIGEVVTTAINLKVPAAPEVIQSIPRYLDGQTKILMELVTTFNTVEPFTLSNEIDGSATNYTVTYSDSIFGTICGSFNIPASDCEEVLKCSHTFDILTSSFCPPTTAITVKVYAINVLGRGPPSTGLVRDGINNLVTVEFSSTDRRMTCTFINQQSNNMMKQCIANITYGSSCNEQLGVYIGMGAGDKVKTLPIGKATGVDEYCFVINATSRNVTVLVQGDLQTLDGSNVNIPAAIAIPLVLILLFQIPVIFIIIVSAVKYKKMRKGKLRKFNVCVSFTVKDEAGFLAMGLKVFKEYNINILGLNTHLHHAEFDRNAGEGYKFNYVHCKCTRKEKNFLKNTLKAEFEESEDNDHNRIEIGAVPVTAVIKVKDHPGALWSALLEIGNRGINITGINTLSDRESIPGFKTNYVKCCCTEGSLHSVCTELKMVTGKEVNFKFLDEELQNEERVIEYLVRDEIGALASTLQVISDLGINISGINLPHLPLHVVDSRTIMHGLKINFIECFIDESTKDTLFSKLRREYGAVKVETHQVPTDRLEEDPNFSIVKVTIHNEAGSLNRILKAFRDLKINIKGVNILKPTFTREKEIPHKHYHLEITATNNQEAQLKDKLLARGLAIDIKPFNLAKHQDTDNTDVKDIHRVSEEGDDSTDDISPTTRVIQFLVRDEVGALANALQIFSELGINITKVNPGHLSQEHQDEFVECSCTESQRGTIIDKLKSYGAKNAELLPVQQHGLEVENYCVVKISLSPEVGSIIKVLKAFSDMGIQIFKVNPPHIKLYNQYVECCCTEEEKKRLLTKLKRIPGMTCVMILPEDQVSEKPTENPNYCIVKYSIGDKAGILVRALRVFFDLNINIIGVNTLKPAFNRTIPIKYKHNHVRLFSTSEQEEELKHRLMVTGLAIGVKSHTIRHTQHNEAGSSLSVMEPSGRNGPGVAVTSV